MTTTSNIKLNNIDPEDIQDSLLKLEKSFEIKFAANSFKDAKTFGDICDIIENHMNFTHKNDCTTQQAFYKVRNAIVLSQDIPERSIEPQTKLEDIFYRKNRRKNVIRFEHTLGIPLNILSIKTRLRRAIDIGFFLSLIPFAFNWQVGLISFSSFILFTWAVSKSSKELNISTVGQLAEKFSREHYSLSRRDNETVNKNEIVKTIQDVFIAEHLLKREHFTRDATLG